MTTEMDSTNSISTNAADEKFNEITDKLRNVEATLNLLSDGGAESRAKEIEEVLREIRRKVDEISAASESAMLVAEQEKNKAIQANTEIFSLKAAAEAARVVAESERDAAVQAAASARLAKTDAEAERDKTTKANAECNAAKTSAEVARIAAETEQEKSVQASRTIDEEKNKTIAASNDVISAKATAEQQRDAAQQARLLVDKERENAAAIVSQIASLKTNVEAEQERAKQAAFYADAEREKAVQMAEFISKAKATAEAEIEKISQIHSDIKLLLKQTVEEKNLAITAREVAEGGKNEIDSIRKNALEEYENAKTAREKAVLEATGAAEAHNLSTTAGLAGAFNEKAQGTKKRELFWACALISSLSAAAIIGWVRYQDLTILINTKPDNWALAADCLLALLGVGAPVWLAWMATRMISKNFVLTEDYGYKASIAKAYLGFKNQAQGLDPLLEQRLFAAAITQLDANPVRLLDSAHPASPLQDLLQQPFMQNVLEDATIKQHLIDWLKSRFNTKLTLQNKDDTHGGGKAE